MNKLVVDSPVEERVALFLRLAVVYVTDGHVRQRVIERLQRLHELAPEQVADGLRRLRAAGVQVLPEPEAAVPHPAGVELPIGDGDTDAFEDPGDLPEDTPQLLPDDVPPDAQGLVRARIAALSLLEDRRLGLVNRHRVLTALQETGLSVLVRNAGMRLDDELPVAYRRSQPAGSVEARAFDALVEHNMRLVWSVSRGYGGRGLEWDDLRSSGMFGLLRAVEKFDATLGLKFSTYATWWIRQSISRSLANEALAIRLPVHVAEQANRARAVQRSLQATAQGQVGSAAVAKRLGVTREHVRWLFQISAGTFSLDRKFSDDDELTLGDVLMSDFDIDAVVARGLLSDALVLALEALSARESAVIRLRFGIDSGDPRTLEEVGTEFGVTRERIRQIQTKALGKLGAGAVARQLRPYYAANGA